MNFEPRRRDSWIVAAVAFLARVVVVLWAAKRFPPTADGSFYDRIAGRIAEGHGYTWLWPDGVVTYAGHYPVGYPALVGFGYALFGAHPVVAMMLNAVIGSLAAVAVHRLSLRATTPRLALIAGLLVALHPGLVAYTPALMSEGVTAALVTCAAWISGRVRDASTQPTKAVWKWLVVLGLVTGLATLVRPQSIVFAPLFALVAVAPWIESASWKRVGLSVCVATISAFVLIAPWTARNCARMGSCALVSYNGGWNLLIGADSASTGAWSPVKVPYECREVWDEAAKDECFGRAARRFVALNPAEWLALVPRKLAATFDYCGAAGWYLHESNAAACDDRCKLALGTAETIYERLLVLLGLVWASNDSWRQKHLRKPTPLTLIRFALLVVGVVCLFRTHAWIAFIAFVIVSLLRGRDLLRGPVLASCAVIVVGLTAATHAVFFGAGRYGLVTFPLLAGVAILAFSKKPSDRDDDDVASGSS